MINVVKRNEFIDKASLLVSVLDQSAANSENGEADLRLAESAANVANTLRNIFQRIEKRLLNRVCNAGLK